MRIRHPALSCDDDGGIAHETPYGVRTVLGDSSVRNSFMSLDPENGSPLSVARHLASALVYHATPPRPCLPLQKKKSRQEAGRESRLGGPPVQVLDG
jgi:hypothetical protein